MKKTTLTLLLIIFNCLILTACGTKSNGDLNNTSSFTECEHNYVTQVTEPTCITKGYTTYKCSKCNKSYTDNYVDALGHDYVEREQNYKCTRCDHYEDEGYTFELITYEMARYNDAYKGRINTYEVKSVSSKALENRVLTIPRKHLGYVVTGLYKGSLYNVRTSIASLKIGNNIKYIGSLLFCYDGQFSSPNQALALEKIIFDNSCTDICISHTAFHFCKKTADISFPNNCFSSFNHDDMIGNHFLFEDTPYYKNNAVCENGIYYLKNMALTSNKDKLNSSVVIKYGTYLIANQCFSENTNIKSVTLPTSITYIGKKAFYKNLSLTSVKYKGTENQFNNIVIDDNAFELCGNIVYSYNS